MKCVIPEISWHNRDPVLSIDIQPKRSNDSTDIYRLASGGTDSHVLVSFFFFFKIKANKLHTRHITATKETFNIFFLLTYIS